MDKLPNIEREIAEAARLAGEAAPSDALIRACAEAAFLRSTLRAIAAILTPAPRGCEVFAVEYDSIEFDVAIDVRDGSVEGVYLRGIAMSYDHFQPTVWDDITNRALKACEANRQEALEDEWVEDCIDAGFTVMKPAALRRAA